MPSELVPPGHVFAVNESGRVVGKLRVVPDPEVRVVDGPDSVGIAFPRIPLEARGGYTFHIDFPSQVVTVRRPRGWRLLLARLRSWWWDLRDGWGGRDVD